MNGRAQRWRTSIRAVLLLLFLCSATASGQSINARVSLLALSPGRARVEGRCAEGSTVWSFRTRYGSAGGLGERIENLDLSDDSGAHIPVRKIAPGEYSAASPAARFAYEVRLDPPVQISETASVSWLTTERGLLLPGDLLPRQAQSQATDKRRVQLRIILPATWSIATNELEEAEGQYQVANPDTAVFLVGPELRRKHERVGGMDFAYVTQGRWAFTDEEVASLAASILKDHTGMLGGAARSSAMLILIPFPRAVGADRWSAETRGGTVVLLSGQAPSRTAALAQLSVPLTHELFHLWVPNGLALP